MQKNSSELYKAIFELAPDAIVVIDSEGVIEYTNMQCISVLGYAHEELAGKKIECLLPERFREKHVHHRSHYQSSPSSRPMGSGLDLYALHKNGYEIAVDISIAPIATPEGSFFAAAIRDVTEKKKTELQLIERTKELEQFVYIASHDLQEPLTNIQQFVGLLRECTQGKLNEDEQSFLELIEKSSKRMSSLIRDLLDHSRIGREKEPETISLQECVNDALENLRTKIETSKAKITVDGELPEIRGHKTELVLLFQNILGNALKFHKKETCPEVVFTCTDLGDAYQFEVRDNGVGIPEKSLEKIFTLFTRLHGRSEFEGNGIGLAHCKKIVELHHGTISCTSKEGEGTVFLFTLRKDL